MDINFLFREGLVPLSGEINLKSVRYPTWYYKLTDKKPFVNFVNEIIQKILCKEQINHSELWKKHFVEDINIKPLAFEKWLSTLFEETLEYSDGYFYHPKGDFLCFSYISTNPSKEEKDIMLQACKLISQAKLNSLQVNTRFYSWRTKFSMNKTVVILLPLHKTGFQCDFSNWQGKKFEKLLSYNKAWNLLPRTKRIFIGSYGNHLSKKALIEGVFTNYNKPYQMFLSSPQSNNTNIEEIKSSLYIFPETPCFVHGKYIYNLCTSENWMIEGLKKELIAAKSIFARGVVVHVGKSKDLDLEIALNNMYENIHKVLEVATEKCPLILETCAGQGTEVLSSPYEFSKFYNKINKSNFKICLDSAHCWGSGWEPLFFLNYLEKKSPGSVVLVHFNDSKVIRGAYKDRHETPGIGYIGYESMKELHDYCVERNIPMIQE